MKWKTIKKNGNNIEIDFFSETSQHTFYLDPSKNWVNPKSYIGLLGFDFYKKQRIDSLTMVENNNEVSSICYSSNYTTVDMTSSFEQTLSNCTGYTVNFYIRTKTSREIDFDSAAEGSSIKIEVYENNNFVAKNPDEIKETSQYIRHDDDYVYYTFYYNLYRHISETPSDIDFKVVFSFHNTFGRFYIEKKIVSGSYNTGSIKEKTALDHVVFILGD